MMTTIMMIVAKDPSDESVQRASNACDLRASRSTKKHRHVLEAVLALSFTRENFQVRFLISQVSFNRNITRCKELFET